MRTVALAGSVGLTETALRAALEGLFGEQRQPGAGPWRLLWQQDLSGRTF